MNNAAVKITDKKQIFEIIQTRFHSGKIYVKMPDINIMVESFVFEDGIITITGPFENENTDCVIFYVRDGDEVVLSNAALLPDNEPGKLSFKPLDLQIFQIPRKEERKSVAQVDRQGTVPIYISNIISDFTIHECFSLAKKRVDIIKEELIKKLKSRYPESDIIFAGDKSGDPRMFYFKNKRKPYFIKNNSDVFDQEKVNNDEDLKYYKTYIMPKDQLLQGSKSKSEIAVPLLYKLMMPFGYVVTASPEILNDEDFSTIRKFGMSASTVYTNDKQIIISSEDKIAVTDLSMNGLGIFFKEKVLIKHFKENSLIVFTVYLPEKKQATMLCEVRNISLIKNYVYRIGCEILNIEAIGEFNYSEYIDTLNSHC